MVLAFVALSVVLVQGYQELPDWFVYGDAAFFIVVVTAAAIAPPASIWRRVERPAGLAAVALAFLLNALKLERIVDALLSKPQTLKPLPLFHTSVALWFANILIFTLAYWLLDAGGPGAREAGTPAHFDFDFPARSDPSKLGPGWQPTIVDYLFIAFTTNTSFGPTEAMPLTARAKALMILQSFISLVTIAGVAARAIGATG
jgi:hypothetical protein